MLVTRHQKLRICFPFSPPLPVFLPFSELTKTFLSTTPTLSADMSKVMELKKKQTFLSQVNAIALEVSPRSFGPQGRLNDSLWQHLVVISLEFQKNNRC